MVVQCWPLASDPNSHTFSSSSFLHSPLLRSPQGVFQGRIHPCFHIARGLTREYYFRAPNQFQIDDLAFLLGSNQ